MKSSLLTILIFAVVATGGLAWAQDDPTLEPALTPGDAGVTVSAEPFYPFTSVPTNPGNRHCSAAALPNGNFLIVANTYNGNSPAAPSNMAAVIVDPQGSIVAGPSPVAADANGPIPYDVPGVEIEVGDLHVNVKADGSEAVIGMAISGAENLNFTNALYPNDPGFCYIQRISMTDLSPIGEAVAVFPGAVTNPTPDETNFGYFPAAYMPNGNIILVARSRDQWSSALRDTYDPPNRVETQRVGTMTIVSADASQVIVEPTFFGREYGYDLLASPNQWNAEPSRGIVQVEDGCIVYLAGAQGWVHVDQDGNAGEWHYFYAVTPEGNEALIGGDGNQGALLSDGKSLVGRTTSEGSFNVRQAVVYDAQSGERLHVLNMSEWEGMEKNERTYGAMNSKGEVFMTWHETGLFGLNEYTPVGRFSTLDGVRNTNTFLLMANAGDPEFAQYSRGQAAFSDTHAMYLSHDVYNPDRDPSLPAGQTEVVATIFENPLYVPVEDWTLH